MDAYATHQPVTVTALFKTAVRFPQLPILECGCGDYSSLLVKVLKNHREHVIMSADPEWYERYRDIADQIIHVELAGKHKWQNIEFTGDWGLCLMDSEEYVNNRVKQIPKLLDVCRVVVMHDAHVIPEAKYSYLYTRLDPPTWIGSNQVDVGEWFQ